MWTRPASVVLLFTCLAMGMAAADQPAGAGGSPFSGPVTDMEGPAPVGSAQPFLTVGPMGRVFLSWLEPREGGGRRFRMAWYRGAAWSDPVTVAEGDDLLANWADVPAIHVTSTTIAASWLARGPGRGYGIRARTSSDAGRTWTPTVTPHRDDTTGEHGFVSFFELPGAGPDLGLVWLDGREVADGGSMTLRAATLAGGSPGEEMVVDARVCDCCPTSAARIDGGAIVAYRDRSDDEVRDIAVSRFLRGRWTVPTTVHADTWQIEACPVNGPVVAASGRSVAVAWYTVAGGQPHAKVAFSTDGGESFSAPLILDVDVSYGRLAIAMIDDGRVLVSSVERSSSGTQIVVRGVRRNGWTSDAVRVAATTTDRTAGFPRMVVSGRDVIFAWTEIDANGASRVRIGTARLK